MKKAQPFWKVAFLDTNTLHYIGIYLEYAKKNNLSPQDPKAKAIAKINNLSEADLQKSLKKGLKTIDFLSTQDVQVQYAPISELELLTGKAKGKAILSAAKEGISDRMWSRFREEEIRDRVGPTDLADIKDRIDGLTSMLEEFGIAVKTSLSNQASDVLELAKEINGLVYMGAMDSIIYANALVVQADYFLTSDGYLKDTINHIHDPRGEPQYKKIKQQLREIVRRIILGNADDVELPSAHTVTDRGTLKPDLGVPRTDSSS